MFSSDALQDLFSYLDDIHGRERDLLVKKDVTDTEMHLGALAALSEEFGELASEIRRKEQMIFNPKKAELASVDNILLEGMDVLITTLLLLKKYHPGLLDSYLYEKIDKNKARGY